MLPLQVLTERLGEMISSLSFKRSMRWNSSATFSRPVRWLVGLHGASLLPFAVADLQAAHTSRGLRNTPDFQIGSAASYM